MTVVRSSGSEFGLGVRVVEGERVVGGGGPVDTLEGSIESLGRRGGEGIPELVRVIGWRED